MSARTKAVLPTPSKRPRRRRAGSKSPVSAASAGVLFLLAVAAAFAILILRERYTFSVQSPVKIHFQWPLVVAAKTSGDDAMEAQALEIQGLGLSADPTWIGS